MPVKHESFDVVVAGAGVVGMSVATALLESKPRLKVLVVEKEKTLGEHASGRNSRVLHAGFYYSPDSLKARFCRDGNRELKELCRTEGIPVVECGKVVVTQNEDEEGRCYVPHGSFTVYSFLCHFLLLHWLGRSS